jgi:8-oxo-dGTP pyrophosphatase MutT (NUDIX family)
MPDIVRRASKIVFENPWLRLRVDDIVYADGTPGTYSVLEKGDFVVVLPWDRGGFWLVEQYRYPVGQRCWEFPQGGWPSGQGGDQAELARHELREETGHTASTWQHLGRLFAVAGYSNQAFDVFLASGLVTGEPEREHTAGHDPSLVHARRGSLDDRRRAARRRAQCRRAGTARR